ncbi:lanthionine synthetase C family protein [Actinomadura mexicana]|uniref:Lanthionine synthetase C-like protein n=1 Tax=Actinomadura mexicana TaxID=134959 RepID=A0A239GUX0_9ACTN|nr:lanthionine synthetase C family protein [Actinomadura mexicana]SNS72675.1 Lanthionine synthetase C-like protein [Actinomadura mexicana]
MSAPTKTRSDLADAADQYAALLARPEPPSADRPWLAQALHKGAAGTALLHIERARCGRGSWQQAHTWITHAVAGEVSAAHTAGLYLGAPAIAFVLDTAAGSESRYQNGLADVDRHVAALAHDRVDLAAARVKRGDLPGFHEYDVFFGLTGIGALLLRRDPGGSAMERVLTYLVDLTRPVPGPDGRSVPGWWVGHDPHRRESAQFRAGHGNFGFAHGITGPLALLSHAARGGVMVDGHADAIHRITAWLDAWRQDSDKGPWWPEWITLAELRAHRPNQLGPHRPSWCYGTPGIARAGQLAGLASGNPHLRRTYEEALLRCLQDPAQQAKITDAGICHGLAGLCQTAWRAAQDAACPALAACLPDLADRLGQYAHPNAARGSGFLEGNAGTALALTSAASDSAPTSGWDRCLLIS